LTANLQNCKQNWWHIFPSVAVSVSTVDCTFFPLFDSLRISCTALVQ